MKALSTTLPLTLAFGGVVALLAMVLPLEPEARTAALVGALLAALCGGLSMVIKMLLTGPGLTETGAVKALIVAQGSSFMLRLLAVMTGALAIRKLDLSVVAFVIPFFVVSLAQQALETRTLLASATRAKSSEVIS